jgi:hypothetical protein
MYYYHLKIHYLYQLINYLELNVRETLSFMQLEQRIDHGDHVFFLVQDVMRHFCKGSSKHQ